MVTIKELEKDIADFTADQKNIETSANQQLNALEGRKQYAQELIKRLKTEDNFKEAKTVDV